jgi:hypothetical protein
MRRRLLLFEVLLLMLLLLRQAAAETAPEHLGTSFEAAEGAPRVLMAGKRRSLEILIWP